MGKKYLGIDIEDRFLKLVVMKDGKVLKTCLEVMPDNIVMGGRIAAFHALSDYLRDTVRRNKIRVKDAAFALPSETYYIRRVKLPKMTAAQLQINLPYEFHDYLQDDTDQYVFDYSVLSVDEKSMELLIAALSKRQVEQYKEMCKRAGLRLCKLVPDVLAIQEIVLPSENPAAYRKRLAAQEKSRSEEEKRENRSEAREKKQHLRDRKRNGLSVEELSARAAEEARANGMQPADAVSATPGNATASANGMTPGNAAAPANGMAPLNAAPSGSIAAAEEKRKDYAVLSLEYSRDRLHFFSNGAYEITRNLGITEKQICEVIAQNEGVDIHIAQLMLDRNQNHVLEQEQVSDLLQSVATEVMRVMNFYNYNNPRNTIDAIYYYGREVDSAFLERIQSMTELPIRPLTDLLEETSENSGPKKSRSEKPVDNSGAGNELLMMLQGYGAVLE
ncbi:MAG: type II secretion system protein GspL [Lachnospiraceae bacterium]|nr:type II secretion system protein GspL [Lachnospiraceae bacterium]